uniref:Odorant receptor 5 n=1 Tax=Streltzoviella insularis TaxID=1206366 RepID=A0A7D5YVJ5_9NEOP|nr:odorant receptor 5 [Streltzoviella insularis]
MRQVDENIQDVKETLPKLINRHIMILDTIDKLKTLYSVPTGVDFGSNAVCMSLFCFLSLQEYVTFMTIILYAFAVFFLYCYLCQCLINASGDFERAVYSCGWENLEWRDKKTIYVMLLQAQKPIELLAANIIPINIATFASTIQAIYKFVTVVKF